MTNHLRCIWDEACILGESPIWHPKEQVLYWVDILKPRLHRYNPKTNLHDAWDMPTSIGCVAPKEKGGLIAAFKTQVGFFDPITATIEFLASIPEKSAEQTVFNDGHCDYQGRFWAGTKDFLAEKNPTGEIFCYDAHKKLMKKEDHIIVSNGVIASPDSRYFFIADSPTRIIYRYEFDSDAGVIHDRVPFIKIDDNAGVPDGMTFDSKGYIWSCHFSGWRITRYTPDGKIDRVINMPVSSPTSCCFGGHDLKTLYITSAKRDVLSHELKNQPKAGALFAIDMDVPGIPEPCFKE